MADAGEHGLNVLAGVVAGRGSMNTTVLDYALRHVKPDYFVDSTQRNIFLLAERYFSATGGVITRDALVDMLRDEKPGTALMYAETYDAATRVQLSGDMFKHSCTMMRELAADRRTSEVLTRAMKIHRQGAESDDGKTELRGHEDARAFVLSAMADIDRIAAGDTSPEGDIRHEQHDVLAEYAQAQQLRLQGRAPGILTGIPALDEKLGGSFLRNGQMGLIAGYTSAGKTSWCCQLAWHAAVKQGKSVVYFTTETPRIQVRRKLVARHTREPQFGLPSGLNVRDIAEGSLDEMGVRALQATVADLDGNQSYAPLYVVQMPSRPTLAVMQSRLDLISRNFLPDLVVMDYLQLLHSGRNRQDLRTELSDIVKEAKEVCATAFDGRGYPLVSPWQIGRKGREQLKAEGGYSYESLSETQEAPQTTDLLLSLIDHPDTSQGRNAPLEVEVLKNRDGERGGSVRVTADYANAYFDSRDRTQSAREIFSIGG